MLHHFKGLFPGLTLKVLTEITLRKLIIKLTSAHTKRDSLAAQFCGLLSNCSPVAK